MTVSGTKRPSSSATSNDWFGQKLTTNFPPIDTLLRQQLGRLLNGRFWLRMGHSRISAFRLTKLGAA
jgi:hypothetical protein